MNKIKNECSIVKDLLPLYAEGLVSAESAGFIEEHMESCDSCKSELGSIREGKDAQKGATEKAVKDASPLLKLRKKLALKRAACIAVSVIATVAFLLIVYAVLSSPEYIPYSEGEVKTTETGGGDVIILLPDEATDYSCTKIRPEPGTDLSEYHVSSWRTASDRLFASREANELALVIREAEKACVYYDSNDGTEGTLIYGEAEDGSAGVVSLPRLALNYYLYVMLALAAILLVVLIVFRKNERARNWLVRLELLPVSYIVSHFIVSGIRGYTYSLPRDFYLILLISFLLFAAFLAAYGAISLKREIREIETSADF